MVSEILYFHDVDPDTERQIGSTLRMPTWQTLRDWPGFRGVTVYMDTEHRLLTVVTLWSDISERDHAHEHLAPLFEAVRLALGAPRAEQRSAIVVYDARPRVDVATG